METERTAFPPKSSPFSERDSRYTYILVISVCIRDVDREDDGNSQQRSADMNSGKPKLSAEEASAKRRLLTEIVAHFPSEEVVNYYVDTLRELVPISEELRAEAIAFFHEARQRPPIDDAD